MRMRLILAMEAPEPDERVVARCYHQPSTVKFSYSIACASDLEPVTMVRAWDGYLTDGFIF